MDTLRSLPPRFWWLCLSCAIGFGLLWWATLGERRRRRLALLRQALAATADADGVCGPLPLALADAPHPRILFIGTPGADVSGLLAAGGVQLQDASSTGSPWRTGSHPALTPIVLHPHRVEDAMAPDARRVWLQGLMALASERPSMPLNGIVVCIEARALPQTPRTLVALVHEAARLLQLRLPVYLVVTGLEQLPGYAQVRAGLPAEVLGQAVGHRFAEPPIDAGHTALQQLDAGFGTIAPRLEALSAALMRGLPQPAARLAVLQWSDHVLALQAALGPLVEGLFEPAGHATWRGLFFTAGGETGTSAFETDLFHRFLPEDRALARNAERA
jgi:hypothetical protein